MPVDTRQRIVEAAYACVARWGLAKTTVEDVAREAGISRATVYRAFPGGRDELINAMVAWARRLLRPPLRAVPGRRSLEEVMERGIMFAHRSIVEHEVLQRVMQTEPEKLLPILTVESNRIRDGIAVVLAPYLRTGGPAPGSDLGDAADFLARMVLSYISPRAAGTWRTPTRWPGWSGPSCWPAWSCHPTLTGRIRPPELGGYVHVPVREGRER